MNINLKKISKVTAIILLPTALVILYFLIKWFYKKYKKPKDSTIEKIKEEVKDATPTPVEDTKIETKIPDNNSKN